MSPEMGHGSMITRSGGVARGIEKSFRVKFKVPSDVAAVLESTADRAAYVARAVEWYTRFGGPCIDKLDEILAFLRDGKLPEQKVDEEIKRQLDDAFAGFEI
jgi:hypothetical protein